MQKKSKCHASGTRLVRIRVNAISENVSKSLVDVEVPDDASMEEVEQAIVAAAVDPDLMLLTHAPVSSTSTPRTSPRPT